MRAPSCSASSWTSTSPTSSPHCSRSRRSSACAPPRTSPPPRNRLLQGGGQACEVVLVRPPAARDADEAAPGYLAHCDVGLREAGDQRRRILRPEGDERCVSRYDLDVGLQQLPAAAGLLSGPFETPVGRQLERGQEAHEAGGRNPAGVEAGRAGCGLETPGWFVGGLREVARPGDAQPL